jgi:adenylate cyclase class 2
MKQRKTPTRRPAVTVGNEIEVKLRVADRAALRRRLLRLRAKAEGVRVHEMNTLYDTPEGVLRGSGQLLRIREERPAAGAGRLKKPANAAPPVARLTYKGPEQPKGSGRAHPGPAYKVREEREGRIRDGRAVAAVLKGMGLRPSFRYEKYRTTFRLPGVPGLKVELDETPIGDFLELEGGRKAIDRAAKLLGFRPANYITRSYPALCLEYTSHRPVAKRRDGAQPVCGKAGMLFSKRE